MTKAKELKIKPMWYFVLFSISLLSGYWLYVFPPLLFFISSFVHTFAILLSRSFQMNDGCTYNINTSTQCTHCHKSSHHSHKKHFFFQNKNIKHLVFVWVDENYMGNHTQYRYNLYRKSHLWQKNLSISWQKNRSRASQIMPDKKNSEK